MIVMEISVVVLAVIGVGAAIVKFVRDPDPPPPATLESGSSHMRGERPEKTGMGWIH